MKPIQIDFKPSSSLGLIIFAMGSGASAIILNLPALNAQIKLLLVMMTLVAVIYHICRYGLLMLPWSCVALKINSKNQLQVIYRNGRLVCVDVCRDTVVTPYLTVINCKAHDANFFARLLALHIVILPDMLDAENFRQLRVWLRWGKPDKLNLLQHIDD